ncbi:MAG: sulfide/dihydroorotate dehydrogenase-like FAD/NAD-binding protein [Chitinivibrionales bacterium]|nr:sulfide/dihydroorotate dehydrogenase-like FAD/NAD-binding protein [Chitinivibrionales bacterium]
MNEIIKTGHLSESVYRFRITAPRIAKKRKAGQFIILRPQKDSERIPLTIADASPSEGWIEIIFQIAGRTTRQLSELKTGDSIPDLSGPLGKPTHIEKFGRCICIGGGVGIAPLYPIVGALKEAGNSITTIIGARTENLLIIEDEMKARSDNFYIATDDGSKGTKGFVSTVFSSLLEQGQTFDYAIVIGPVIMMKVTTRLIKEAGIPCMASLNPIMVDGTGMCGGCRVTVNGETKFACVDGPEFDAAGVDWDELIKRLKSYSQFEQDALEKHECRLRGSV